MSAGAMVTVYYDGSCPVCRHEIAFYRRRGPLVPVRFQDIAATTGRMVADDLALRDALAVLHVRDLDGALHRGVAAFLFLWSCYPGLRLLARLGALPVLRPLLELGYRAFLRWRAGRSASRVQGPCMGGEECMPLSIAVDDRSRRS